MRRSVDIQSYISWFPEATNQEQVEYRAKYEGVSTILEANPEVVELVHRDLLTLSDGSEDGREATYTSENVLRALVVHVLEGGSYRHTAVEIAEKEFLHGFLRLGNRPPMGSSFLCMCFKAIEPETWKRINQVLGQYGVENGKITPEEVRTDTTVTETNIHYPTDSSLLWDSWRVMVRLINQARELCPGICPNRFHEKKVKKLYLFVCRYFKSSSKRRQGKAKRKLIQLLEHVKNVVQIVEGLVSRFEASELEGLQALATEMNGFLPAVKNVASVAERVQVLGERVPAREKTYSIFEQHTELIKRGRAQKPVEFGHKVQVTQTKEKFITDYEVMKLQKPDQELTEPTVDNHQEQFGSYPTVVAADKGFRASAEVMANVEEKVDVVAIPARPSDWGREELKPWQSFRSGIEGSISVLKRAFRLCRCFYRGFKSYAASIGMSIVCHNLVQLARL